MFKCKKCDATFTRRDNLQRHEERRCVSQLSKPQLKKIKKDDSLQNSNNDATTSKHTNSTISKNTINCEMCNMQILARFYNSHLKSLLHKRNIKEKKEEGVEVIKSAFKNRIISYRLSTKKPYVDFNDFFNEIEENFYKIIKEEIRKHNLIKFNMEVFGAYLQPTSEICDVKSFITKNEICTESCNIEEIYKLFKAIIITKSQDFQEKDSGNSLEKGMNYFF